MEVEVLYPKGAGIPDGLPSLSAIADAPRAQDLGFGKRVVIVEGRFVVKYGPQVQEIEGNTLIFLQENLDIPAPRLHAMYRICGEIYLIMSKVDGETLEALWPRLSNTQKDSVALQLKEILDKMRAISSPGFYGSVNGGSLQHRFFLTIDPRRDINGPFFNEKDFISALTQQCLIGSPNDNSLPKYLDQHLHAISCGNPSVFTHSDLHKNNIIVTQTDNNITISGLVDWETAGWYPNYWEYAASFVEFEWIDDWPSKFTMAIQPSLIEAAVLRMIRQVIDY